MLERLGIADELAARRERFKRYAYVAPEDRLLRSVPPKPAPVVAVATPVRVPALRFNYKGGGSRGGGRLVEDMEGMTVKVRDVISIYAEAFQVEAADIFSSSRKTKHVRPRHAVMHYLSCRLKLSFHSVGKLLKRDHSSAVSGRDKADFLLANDTDFLLLYAEAARLLNELWAARFHATAQAPE